MVVRIPFNLKFLQTLWTVLTRILSCTDMRLTEIPNSLRVTILPRISSVRRLLRCMLPVNEQHFVTNRYGRQWCIHHVVNEMQQANTHDQQQKHVCCCHACILSGTKKNVKTFDWCVYMYMYMYMYKYVYV